MSATQTPAPQPPAPLAEPETPIAPSRWQTTMQAIVTGNGIISLLAVLLAVLVGSIMIAATDEEVQAAPCSAARSTTSTPTRSSGASARSPRR